MEKLTLLLCLAVGIAAVPIPDAEIVSAPAGPVVVLTPDAPLFTNAVESYVIIEENQGKEPETEIYTVYSPLTAELTLLNHSVQESDENPEHGEAAEPPHVEPVGDPASSDESESPSSSTAPAPKEPITEEPLAVESAPIVIPIPKPELVNLQGIGSSSPFGGIISFLNPFHLSVPSISSFIPIKWPWSSRLGDTSSSKYSYIALKTPYHVYYAI